VPYIAAVRLCRNTRQKLIAATMHPTQPLEKDAVETSSKLNAITAHGYEMSKTFALANHA